MQPLKDYAPYKVTATINRHNTDALTDTPAQTHHLVFTDVSYKQGTDLLLGAIYVPHGTSETIKCQGPYHSTTGEWAAIERSDRP